MVHIQVPGRTRSKRVSGNDEIHGRRNGWNKLTAHRHGIGKDVSWWTPNQSHNNRGLASCERTGAIGTVSSG